MSLFREVQSNVLECSIMNVKRELQVPRHAIKVSVAVYDRSVYPGAIGTYELPLSVTIPQGAVITDLIIQEVEPLTSVASYQAEVGINFAGDYATGVTVSSPPATYPNGGLRVTSTTGASTMKWTILQQPIISGVAYFKFLYFEM